MGFAWFKSDYTFVDMYCIRCINGIISGIFIGFWRISPLRSDPSWNITWLGEIRSGSNKKATFI